MIEIKLDQTVVLNKGFKIEDFALQFQKFLSFYDAYYHTNNGLLILEGKEISDGEHINS